MKAFYVRVPDSVHKDVKLYAQLTGVTIQKLIIDSLEEKMRR